MAQALFQRNFGRLLSIMPPLTAVNYDSFEKNMFYDPACCSMLFDGLLVVLVFQTQLSKVWFDRCSRAILEFR